MCKMLTEIMLEEMYSFLDKEYKGYLMYKEYFRLLG